MSKPSWIEALEVVINAMAQRGDFSDKDRPFVADILRTLASARDAKRLRAGKGTG